VQLRRAAAAAATAWRRSLRQFAVCFNTKDYRHEVEISPLAAVPLERELPMRPIPCRRGGGFCDDDSRFVFTKFWRAAAGQIEFGTYERGRLRCRRRIVARRTYASRTKTRSTPSRFRRDDRRTTSTDDPGSSPTPCPRPCTPAGWERERGRSNSELQTEVCRTWDVDYRAPALFPQPQLARASQHSGKRPYRSTPASEVSRPSLAILI